MLDIKFIRDNVDIIKKSAKKKRIDVDVDSLIALDDARLRAITDFEEQKAIQNQANLKIQNTKDVNEKNRMISDMRILKEEIKEKENTLRKIMSEWNNLMLTIPNVPDISVPEGEDDKDNVEIKKWGEIPQYDFEMKDHIEIMKNLDMVDFERGVKVHGFRGYFLKGEGVLLSMAIWNYAMSFFASKGFIPLLAPAIVKQENLYGTGHLPNEAEDLYETQDGDILSGTAEVPIMGYHRDEILNKKDFPLKYLGFSPCYRREAGSYGKDTKGLIRVNEFYKVEQVVLCEADHETTVKLHEEINRNTEEFIESLGIPYHTVINCGGDLGFGQVKKYDIELWVPAENKYREISSASYFNDFQTRRFGIRYRDHENNLQFTHSLNCTAIPTPRILVSMAENFQTKDGSIIIPPILRPYFGKDKISRK